MTKLEVEKLRLGGCVVMPANLDCSFMSLWRSVEPTDEVEVQTPHRESISISEDNFYFSPIFSTIQIPEKGTSHYQKRVRRFIVRVQLHPA